ncbi:MAG: MltA domain-containing protein [Acidobacteriota bacterium]
MHAGRSSHQIVGVVITGFFLAALTGCARWPETPPPVPSTAGPEVSPISAETALRPVPIDRLPTFLDDGDGDWSGLRTALDRHRRWLAGRPADRTYRYGDREISVATLRAATARLLAWLDDEPTVEGFAMRVANHFDVLESVGDPASRDGEVLVTGYYEPLIEGSLRRRPGYDVPIYGPARGLIRVDLGAFDDRFKGQRIAGLLRGNRLVPFPDRQGIREEGTMRGREIAWAKDPVDLFFLEVQGSGALRLPDGGELRIGYAGANGRAYSSIGKLLIEEGHIPREEMSMQALRRWLAEHPDDVRRVLDHNQSMVFFRRLDGPPVGNLGVPVTPGRSIAVDQKLLPPGAFGFLFTELPAPGPDGRPIVEGTITRFVLAQDRGGAIRGPDRVDLFWGRGEDAAARAGVMQQPGRLLIFAPKVESAAR